MLSKQIMQQAASHAADSRCSFTRSTPSCCSRGKSGERPVRLLLSKAGWCEGSLGAQGLCILPRAMGTCSSRLPAIQWVAGNAVGCRHSSRRLAMQWVAGNPVGCRQCSGLPAIQSVAGNAVDGRKCSAGCRQSSGRPDMQCGLPAIQCGCRPCSKLPAMQSAAGNAVGCRQCSGLPAFQWIVGNPMGCRQPTFLTTTTTPCKGGRNQACR